MATKKARSLKVGGRKNADFPDALIVNKATRQAREWHHPLEGV